MNRKLFITAGLTACLFLFSACLAKAPAAPSLHNNADKNSCTIPLDHLNAIADCEGVEINGNLITITEAGAYELTGSLEKGQLVVDCEGKVTLTLCGVSLSNPEASAIKVKNAKSVTLRLADNTENVLTSGQAGAKYNAEDASGAVIQAKDDLTITGEGSLVVSGYINNGISSNDCLSIAGGKISISAAKHGVKGKDKVTVSGGNLTIEAGKTGIRSGDGDGTGDVELSGGAVTVRSGGHGILGEHNVDISGGLIHILSNADGVHSDGQISVSGGSTFLSAQDDGIHADNAFTITGGAIEIGASYEGLEANQITISGGDISIHATDDGVNACGGIPRFEKKASGKTSVFPVLTISGGSLYVNACGDGIDSNGDILIEGGIVVVDGPATNRNGALDPGTENGGTLLCNGGTVLAVGSSDMAKCFDNTSAQSFLELTLAETNVAESELVITDNDGSVLFSHTTGRSFQSVVFSCAELTAGETYTVSVNGQAYGIIAGVSSDGGGFRGMDHGPGGPGARH